MSAPGAEPAGHRDAAFGLARSAGRVLMVRNDRVSAGGLRSCWDLPGGSLRRGENLRSGLEREWQEETGLQARVGDLRLVMDGRKRRPQGTLLYTWRAFFFDVEASGEPQAGVGIDEAAWVPEAEVLARLDAPYHEALRRHLRGEGGPHAEVDWVEDLAAEQESAGELRNLLIIAASAAVGARDELEREIEQALAADVLPLRILETLLQVVPYAGYPRAITALGVARKFISAETAPAEDGLLEAHATGLGVFREVYGPTSDAVLAGLEARDPVLARWTIEHAYGRVLCREGVLTLLERELLAVSILSAMGGLEAPLLGHMRAVLRLGGSPEDVRMAVHVVPSSFGEQRREAARALLGRLRKV